MRIGLTMRSDLDRWGEPIDSISHHWWTLLAKISDQIEPVPISSRIALTRIKPVIEGIDALILTGGNSLGQDPQRDKVERHLLAEAMQRSISVFAVCRGLQLIQDFYGGSMVRSDHHAGTIHTVEPTRACPSHWQPFFKRQVNSFHHFSIRDVAFPLTALAKESDGNFEAVIDRSKNILGVMWHPERPPIDTRDIELIRQHLQ